MKARGILLGVTAVVITSVLVAHDLYIKLDTFFVPPDSRVNVPILNGTFMESENSIVEDRVLDVSLFAHGRRVPLGTDTWSAGEGQDTTFVLIETGRPGTYVLGASTRHRDFGLSAADFNAYLEHDGIPDVLEQRRKDGELDKDVWERYGKHVKAIIQVGETRTAGFDVKFGYPAEVVALSNPYNLRVGGEITVQCLVDGKPVANQLVLAGGHGARGAIADRSARTDANGQVKVKIDERGRWFIKFIHMAKLPSDPDIDYESKWATLTFEVR